MSRSLARLVAVLALALSALVGMASGAAAHDELVSTSPAGGASGGAPSQVVLRFVDTVLPIGSRVRVVGPDGDATDAAPGVAQSTVTQRLRPGLPPGPYQVDWRAVARDGHPVTGSFTFTVTPATASTPKATTTTAPPIIGQAEATATASPSPSAPPSAPDSPLGELGTGGQAALGIGAVVALAAAAAIAYRRMRDQGGG
jgi:methionine-rich copper-binding protein CopC